MSVYMDERVHLEIMNGKAQEWVQIVGCFLWNIKHAYFCKYQHYEAST